jgi:hypothetical protein
VLTVTKNSYMRKFIGGAGAPNPHRMFDVCVISKKIKKSNEYRSTRIFYVEFDFSIRAITLLHVVNVIFRRATKSRAVRVTGNLLILQ